jgi:hypothetical protein
MVDGFAFFALAIQDNLRAKMKKLKRGGDVSDQLLFSELRKLWEEMGEEQKLEWQCQANNVPSSQSGSHDGSSLNDEDDDDSQDSQPSAGDRSGSAGSFAFRKLSTPRHTPGSDNSGASNVTKKAASRGEMDVTIAGRLDRANTAGATQETESQKQPETWRHLPSASHLAALRGTARHCAMPDLPDWPSMHSEGAQHRAFAACNFGVTTSQPATGAEWAEAARQAVLSSMSLEERLQLGDCIGGSAHAALPKLGLLGQRSASGLEQALQLGQLEQALQLQRQQQQAADMQSLYSLHGQSAAAQLLLNQRLQNSHGRQVHGGSPLVPLHAALQDAQSRQQLPSMILPTSAHSLPHSSLYMQQKLQQQVALLVQKYLLASTKVRTLTQLCCSSRPRSTQTAAHC